MKAIKMIAWLLCAALLFTFLPAAALAAEENPFTDVKTTDWFYDGVQYVYAHGMMNGTGNGRFSPKSTTTRGMIVTILHRLEGTPAAAGTSFSDVSAGKWYADAVGWASSAGIVNGYGNGKFGPEDTITREQMAAILYRYADYKGYDVSAAADLSRFTDSAQISSYARASMGWANASELINGTSGTALSPKGSATRAQAAVILMRFCNHIADSAGTVLRSFTADETYFSVGQNHLITFTVEAEAPAGRAITLVSSPGQTVATMHDDGRNGDAAANDGIYTFRLSTDAAAAGSTTYYASAGSVKSNQVVIYYFDRPTEASVQNDQEIRLEILRIESGYTDADGFVPQSKAADALSAVERYVRSLRERGDVIFYETSGSGIIIKLASGLSIYYSPNIDGVDGIGSDVSMRVITCQPCLSMYSGLDQYMGFPDRAASEIGAGFSNYTFSVANNYDNSAVSLERIKSFTSDQIVLWHGHGGYTDSYHSFLLTGEDFDLDAWRRDVEYWWDCVRGRIIESSDGRVMISSKFIDEYCGNLDHSFFYLAACQSGKDDVLANAFLNKGAAAVIANTETIYTIYNLTMEYGVAHFLTQLNAETGNYYTLSEALSAAKAKHGANDSVWYTGSDPKSEAAAPEIFGGSDANNYRLAEMAPRINHYEVFDQVASTWDEAEQYCESLGGHLATISTQAENDHVYQLMRDAGYLSAYFGYSDQETEKTWVWIGSEKIAYTNWHAGEPNQDNPNEDYAMFYYKYPDGTWNDGDFGGRTQNGGTAFICEWDSESAYNAYLHQKENPSGSHHYEVFFIDVTTWTDAEQYCESLGGHLATITSEEENTLVYQLMIKAGYTSAYFGLSDRETEGTWIWVTGEPASYTNWHPGEPNYENSNEDYAMYYYKFSDGTWNDGDFGGSTVNGGIAFICEWDTDAAYRSYKQ